MAWDQVSPAIAVIIWAPTTAYPPSPIGAASTATRPPCDRLVVEVRAAQFP